MRRADGEVGVGPPEGFGHRGRFRHAAVLASGDDVDAGDGELRQRDVHGRPRSFRPDVADIPHDADDPASEPRDVLADGLAGSEQPPRRAFVGDGHALRVRAVAVVQGPPSQQRDAEDVEVAPGRGHHDHLHPFAGAGLGVVVGDVAGRRHRLVPGQAEARGGGGHAWRALHLVDEGAYALCRCFGVRGGVPSQIHQDGQHVPVQDAEVGRAEAVQRPVHRSRSVHEHRRQGDLHRAGDPQRPSGGGRRAGADCPPLQRVSRGSRREACADGSRRGHGDCGPGREGRAGGGAGGPAAGGGGEEQAVARDGRRPVGEENGSRGPGRNDRAVSAGGLDQTSCGRGAQGVARPVFRGAGGVAEPDDVAERGGAAREHQQQGGGDDLERAGDRFGEPFGQRRDADAGVGVRVGAVGGEPRGDGVRLGPGSGDARFRGQAGGGVEYPRPGCFVLRVVRGGEPQGRFGTRKADAARGDADDGVGPVVHRQHPAERVLRAVQVGGGGGAADDGFVGTVPERPTGREGRVQQAEERGVREVAGHHPRPVRQRYRDEVLRAGRGVAERRARRGPFAVHRPRHSEGGAVPRPVRFDQHEGAVAVGESRRDERFVQDGAAGSRGAAGQREREHGGRRVPRRADEGAQALPEDREHPLGHCRWYRYEAASSSTPSTTLLAMR